MDQREVNGEIEPEVVAEVTPAQETAIALMLAGKTVKEAASGAGVSRAMLLRWIRGAPAFVAAYNGWRREQQQAVGARLLAMTDDAATSGWRCRCSRGWACWWARSRDRSRPEAVRR